MAVTWSEHIQRLYFIYQLIRGIGTYSDTYKWVILNGHVWMCIQKLWNELACRCKAAFCLIELWMSEVIFLWRGSVELQADSGTGMIASFPDCGRFNCNAFYYLMVNRKSEMCRSLEEPIHSLCVQFQILSVFYPWYMKATVKM